MSPTYRCVFFLLEFNKNFQSGLEGNKSSSTFCDKSDNAVLLATPNLWGNIQIVRTCILKHNVSNLMSSCNKTPRFWDFALSFWIWLWWSYVLDNVEDTRKFHFPTYICHGYTLEKMHQHSFSENPVHFSKLLGLIHSDLLELPTLFKVQVGDYISQWLFLLLQHYFFV